VAVLEAASEDELAVVSPLVLLAVDPPLPVVEVSDEELAEVPPALLAVELTVVVPEASEDPLPEPRGFVSSLPLHAATLTSAAPMAAK